MTLYGKKPCGSKLYPALLLSLMLFGGMPAAQAATGAEGASAAAWTPR